MAISCRAYAKHRGVHPTTVSEAIRNKRLVTSVERDHFGNPKIIDAEQADREWDANTDAQKRANAAGGVRNTNPTTDSTNVNELIDIATARLKEAQADLEEIKLAEKRETLVSEADVRREWIEILSQVRTKLLALPSRCKQEIPGLSVSDVELIDRIVREALEDLVASESSS